MMKKQKIHLVVVGSSNTDLVIRCPRLPKPGESLAGGEFARFAGGKGANQAVAAVRAGSRVSFIGAYGGDEFGLRAKAGLRKEGVDVRYFKQNTTAPSGIALILIGGKSRQNLIAVARSANDTVSAEDLEKASAAFRGAFAVVCQLEIPSEAVEAAARLAASHRIPFILNPAPARQVSARLLGLVHTLTPNEHEALLITGKKNPRQAAECLLKRGCNNVVITMGSRGVLAMDRTGGRIIPAPRVKPVDTVGAGDCFTAWLSVGIAEGLPLMAATERAVVAASIAVTRHGAQEGMPFRREVMTRAQSA